MNLIFETVFANSTWTLFLV